jgi:membrane protein YdbS with pleckstrin-like domain
MFADRSDGVQNGVFPRARGRTSRHRPEARKVAAFDRLLAADEEIYLQTRPHAAAILPALGRATAAVALCVAIALLLLRLEPPLWRFLIAGLAVVGVVAIARAARSVWRWEHTLFAVTSDHVLVVRRAPLRTVTVPLITLQRLGFEQSLLGRMLGYGTIELADGVVRRRLRFVPRPGQAHRLILQLGQRVRR